MPVPRLAPTTPKQQAVTEEYLHDAGVRGAQSLKDADVPGLFDDDHGENRQDSEPRDADDQEQQHVKDAPFDADCRQQRPLLVFPGLHEESAPGNISLSAATTPFDRHSPSA